MKTSHLKPILAFLAILAFRLLPFRAPNVEPLLATVMPLSKRYGAVQSFLFAVLSIVVYDALTSGWGSWTLMTAVSYGTLGIVSHRYFKNRKATRGNFVIFSILGVLAYDIVTGVVAGPLMYGQSFSAAIAGQIPFTVLHLLGAVMFAAVVSPALYKWFESSEVFSLSNSKVQA
jgi:uncharacterized membrane protein